MRSQAEVDEVLALSAAGYNDNETARRTGVPRRTVSDWRRGRVSVLRRGPGSCGLDHDPRELAPAAYAYLLGMYLGDGCLSATRGIWRLRVVLDARYPAIIAECARVMAQVVPGKRAHVMRRRDGNCVQVSMWCRCTGPASSLNMGLDQSIGGRLSLRNGSRRSCPGITDRPPWPHAQRRMSFHRSSAKGSVRVGLDPIRLQQSLRGHQDLSARVAMRSA